MTANIGSADRTIRIVAGLALMAFGLIADTPLRWAGLAGPVLIVTAFIRFCPAYWLLRIKTIARQPG